MAVRSMPPRRTDTQPVGHRGHRAACRSMPATGDGEVVGRGHRLAGHDDDEGGVRHRVGDDPLVVVLGKQGADQPDHPSRFGRTKMPTTLVRRRSLFSRSCGLFDQI
jgi:hypothetical protein